MHHRYDLANKPAAGNRTTLSTPTVAYRSARVVTN
jgi:hypothetical protein